VQTLYIGKRLDLALRPGLAAVPTNVLKFGAVTLRELAGLLVGMSVAVIAATPPPARDPFPKFAVQLLLRILVQIQRISHRVSPFQFTPRNAGR
jgi:hypothetical protein